MRDLFIARSREKEKHTKVKQAIILIVRRREGRVAKAPLL